MVTAVMLWLLIAGVEGSVTLTIPAPANCGENASLICMYDGQITQRIWASGAKPIMTNGVLVYPTDAGKYTEALGYSSFTLTIHQTSVSDKLKYRCSTGFTESLWEELQFECKASSAIQELTSAKRLKMTVDKLYPNNTRFSVSQNISGTMIGQVSCINSAIQNYFKCAWTSTSSLADGYYSYSLNVTTISQAAPINGTFRVVTPKAPGITNVQTDNKGRLVIYGVEEESVTIQCISKGGNPIPAVVLYKSAMTEVNKIESKINQTHENDNTYTIAVDYTLTPIVADDKTTYYCRSYYPDADAAYQGSTNTSALLLLTLKPSQPEITANPAIAGTTTEVQCSTKNSRPQASIHFMYNNKEYRPNVTYEEHPATETFTSESVLQLPVRADDNGQVIECIVEHPSLKSPSKLSTVQHFNIFFPVALSSTNITGNKVTVASGRTPLILTCKTGSSNPASDIIWKHRETLLQNSSLYGEEIGENNGVIRWQNLTLYPQRSMDGDIITCSVSNVKFSSTAAVTFSVELHLLYSPLIDILTNVTVVEGDNATLVCTAVSKPSSYFEWSKSGEVLKYGNGTVSNNKLEYTLSRVSRNNASSYTCKADNGIEIPDIKTLVVTVHYPPDVSIEYTNATVNNSTVVLTCVAKGIPSTNYTYGKWFRNWPGRSRSTIEMSGQMLHLANLTYEWSGVYTCTASNNVEKFGTGQYFMEGSVYLLVKSFPIISNRESSISKPFKVAGTLNKNTSFSVEYYSDVQETNVSCFRVVNGSRTIDNICATSTVFKKVDLLVFSEVVSADGRSTEISIKIHNESYFGMVDVVLKNEIGSTVLPIQIVPFGPPSVPFDIKIDNVQQSGASVSWILGFSGGLNQTIVIQLSKDKLFWRNHTLVYIAFDEKGGQSKDLNSLDHSTAYYLRMYAFNQEGSSNFSNEVNFTTLVTESTPSPPTALIGGVAGGSAGIIIIAAVVLVIMLKRKRYISKDGSRTALSGRTRQNSEDSSDVEVIENLAYVSADEVKTTNFGGTSDVTYAKPVRNPASPARDLYASTNKKMDPNSLYAHPDKKEHKEIKKQKDNRKKGQKPAKQTTKDINADIYENTDSTKQSKQSADEESPYENPENSIVRLSEKKFSEKDNKDGLLYADLTFDNQSKGKKKLVIHGIDDKTTYGEIDFSKKADPLPDSDKDTK